MEKNINKMQLEYIERLEQKQNELSEKFNASGYVVAGYGGDTYYCFVGPGRGFNGAALVPMSKYPKIFDTYQDAKCDAYNGIYKNGRNDVIELKVIVAGAYFRKIHTIIEQMLQTLKEML